MKKQFFIFSLLTFSSLVGADFKENRILFMMAQKEVIPAIDQYLDIYNSGEKHNLSLLQQMSLQIIDGAFSSSSPEDQLMAIFGAAISSNSKAFHILEKGMNSEFPEIQLATLNFLGKNHDDMSLTLINKAVASPYPIIRLEAAYQLALKKHPKATAQIEGLMHKLPKEALPLIPKMLAVSGDENSVKILKKLLFNPNGAVRTSAALATAGSFRDDLLPNVRRLATQHDPSQQEAALIALAAFHDEPSIPVAQKLINSPQKNVQIASAIFLKELGVKEGEETLIAMAENEELFAIYALSKSEKARETLFKLLSSKNPQVRLNAILALLELKDQRVIPYLPEILIRNAKDLAFAEFSSTSQGLKAFKVYPSASHQGDDSKILHELSLSFREMILEKTLAISQKEFLQIANLLFKYKQNDLIPTVVNLLVNLDTKEAVDLLKTQEKMAGAPFIRNYAALGLKKMNEEGPYTDDLKKFVQDQHLVDIVKFRPFVPFELREETTSYELTPEESARLLVEILETLTETEENHGIDLLLEVLRNGNPRNRPIIAGILMRATE